MVRPLLLSVSFCIACSIAAQNIGINVNGASPDPSALLDIDVSALAGPKRGLLIPRMTSAERTSIPTPATGLLVYDTTTQGFWYFNGTIWVMLSTGPAGWGITGNAGTNPATNYIGTTDLQPLRFRTMNTASGIIDPTVGNVALGFYTATSANTGYYNTFLGHQSGSGVTSGIQNTMVGMASGASSTVGSNNTYMGFYSGFNSAGSNNTFLGFETGTNNLSGANNTFVGAQAGRNGAAGSGNVFIGLGAGRTNTASSNSFVGTYSGEDNTTGSDRVTV